MPNFAQMTLKIVCIEILSRKRSTSKLSMGQSFKNQNDFAPQNSKIKVDSTVKARSSAQKNGKNLGKIKGKEANFTRITCNTR